MRLIDADVLEAMGYELQRTYQKDANTMIYEVKKIGEIQTIAAEPIRRGLWIENEYGIFCGFCGRYAYRGPEAPWKSDYCPCCGAKMESEE